jgi:integrase
MSRGRALGPGNLRKRDKAWALDYTDAKGRRRRKVLGTDKRVAERRRMDMMARRDMELDGLGSIDGQDMLLTEVVEQYLIDLEPRVTRHHFRNVKGRLNNTLPKLEGMRVRDLKVMDMTRIRSQAVASGSAHRTANLICSTLNAALRWGVEAEILASNPIRHLKKLPETAEFKKYQRRAMTDEEIGRFLAASRQDDETAQIRSRDLNTPRIPQTPLWTALLLTGGRWNEMRLAEWRDIDLREGLLVLRAASTKSRKQRVIPIGSELVEVLRGLKLEQQRVLGRIPRATDNVLLSPDGCTWGRYTTNPMRILDRILKAAGILKHTVDGRKLDIHALRHTFATRLARSGAPLTHAQRLLGHSDPKLTAAVYTHLDAEDLRGAINGIALGSVGATGGNLLGSQKAAGPQEKTA